MSHPTDKSVTTLSAAQVWSATPSSMLYLQVISGRIWLTVSDDAQDYWLAAGAQMQLPGGRHIVIEADQCGARLQLLALNAVHARPLPQLPVAPSLAAAMMKT